MARARVASLAAAAAVLATAAATVDVPEKLHLKATPLLFYAMPISMPLPPLASLESPPMMSMSFPRVATPASLGRDSSSPYASSPFSLAQGAPASITASSRRALSHLLPVTSVAIPRVAKPLFCAPVTTPPALTPFSFSTPPLYTAPVTAYASHLAQAQTSTYLESLLSSLSYFESSIPTQPSHSLHTWHAPTGRYRDGDNDAKEPALTVVLLGWLGAQQKHLKKYADWYNARGIHAVTFVIPMADILSFKVEKNAEEHVEALARHLVQWLHDQGDEKSEKQLMFHTFSNTGWLT